jgi:hypothetical protein
MPDRRRHRGAHPRDRELFDASFVASLRQAVGDSSWLLSRGYSVTAVQKLVGDRYQLVERQRTAVSRAACSDAARERRAARRLGLADLEHRVLAIDGFNAVISIEVALGGGLGILARDGARRDLASIHGTYRRVLETPKAVELLVVLLEAARPERVDWYLDRPVSNSGKLAVLLRERCAASALAFAVELVNDVDRRVSQPGLVAVSADSAVIDAAEGWFDAAGRVIAERVPEAWTLDLGG